MSYMSSLQSAMRPLLAGAFCSPDSTSNAFPQIYAPSFAIMTVTTALRQQPRIPRLPVSLALWAFLPWSTSERRN